MACVRLARPFPVLHPASCLPAHGLGLVLSVGVLLSGCASQDWRDETRKVDATSAHQLIDRTSFETLDLAALLNAYAPGPVRVTVEGDLDAAHRNFSQAAGQAGDPAARAARNALQERILAASTQRCNAFKGSLQRSFSGVNFGLGLAGTIAGTVGALVSGSVANYWSGASAVFSGARAEYNQDFLANLAAHVIVDGIERRQKEVYAQIANEGQKKAYADYPVDAALKDALYYHGLCSVVTGFQVAQDSIKEIDNPGLSTSIRTLAKIKVAQKLDKMDPAQTDIASLLKQASEVASFDYIRAGTYLGGVGTATVPLEIRVADGLEALAAHVSVVAAADATLGKVAQTLAGKARQDRHLKGRLTALGLEPLPTFNQATHLPVGACQAQLRQLSLDRQIFLHKAEKAPGAAEKSLYSLQATLSLERYSAILQGFASLAATYKAKTDVAIDGWNALYENAGTSQAAIDAFRTAVDTGGPVLDAVALGQLTLLCPAGN